MLIPLNVFNALATELSSLEAEMKKIDAELSDFCTQLKIKAPFTSDKV